MPRASSSLKYKPEYCEQVIASGKNAQSIDQFCSSIGISRETYYQWRRKYAKFDEACELATAHCLAAWESMGMAAMMGNLPAGKRGFNDRIWTFFMMNRFRKLGYGKTDFGNNDGGPEGYDV